MTETPAPSRDIAGLIAIMAALRTPGSGCPWDLAQDFASIAPYTVEEAHEVAEAIARGDMEDLRDELGDLLLQVVFHARMAEESGHFAFGDVVEAITRKLIRRHPHVFGEARHLPPDAVKSLWAAIKAEEKAERAARRGVPPEAPASVLGDVPSALPPAQRAVKLQARAAAVGFDWWPSSRRRRRRSPRRSAAATARGSRRKSAT
jgi:ATP diphosphatase